MLQRMSPQTVWSLWLMFATALGATYVQKYKFLDPAGQESSYPNEGGKFEMTCESSDAKEEVQLAEMAAAGKASIVVANGSGNASHQFELQPALLGRSFWCSSQTTMQFGGGLFRLNHILCDPFPLIPKAQNCKPTQICVINNDKTATCNEMTDGLCFPVNSFDLMKTTFSSSLPNFRYACKEEFTFNDERAYGVCHARVLNITQIAGTSFAFSQCLFFTAMLLNGRKVYQDDFIIESKDVSTWNVTFDTTSVYTKIVCKLVTQNDPKFGEVTVYGEQKTVLFASTILKNLKEPTKLRLGCAFHSPRRIMKQLFLYVLVIDMKSLLYQTNMASRVKKSKESVSFECRCSVQPGFFCSLSWKEIPPNTVISKDGVIKQDQLVKHNEEGIYIHNCFTAVFAIGYPASYNLIEVPGSRKTLSRKISKEELALPSGTVLTQSSSSSLNNTNSSSGDDSANKNRKADDTASSISPGVIVAIIAVILTLIICVVVGMILYRRSKSRKPTEHVTVPALAPSKEPNLNIGLPAENKLTKQQKSNVKIKSTQNDEYIRKLQSEKENHVTVDQLPEFLKRLKILNKLNTRDAREGCLKYIAKRNHHLSVHINKQINDCMIVIAGVMPLHSKFAE